MLKERKPRRARYEFVGRTEQSYIDQMKAEYLLASLERGNVRGFNNYIGIIQDYVDCYPDAVISKDWKEILELPYTLFNAAVGRSVKDTPPIDNTVIKSTINSFDRAYKKGD
jgi:hypothetical protein